MVIVLVVDKHWNGENMTREEALKILKYRSGWNLSIRDVNALDMAIKALELCKDTISRQDALDALHMCLSTNSYDDDVTGDSYICYEEAEYEIENLPPVTPKPKMGQWVLLDECSNSGYYCSECHKKLVREGWSGTVKKIKYCPNCGCRMVEPQERSDKE